MIIERKKKENGALNLIYVSSLFQNLGAFVFILCFLVLIELVSYESFPLTNRNRCCLLEIPLKFYFSYLIWKIIAGATVYFCCLLIYLFMVELLSMHCIYLSADETAMV